MNFTEKIIETIKNPRNAMEGIAQQPMIEEAVMIIGIYAVLSALNVYVQFSKITYEGMGNFQSIMMMTGLVFSLIVPFLIWLVVGGISHLVSLAVGGEGKFYPQMMTIVGYSFIPLIFAGIVTVALISAMEPTTITISPDNPVSTDEIYRSPLMQASMVVGTLMQVWAIAIIFFGVQSAHRLTVGKSAVVAGVLLTITLIMAAFSLGFMGIL